MSKLFIFGIGGTGARVIKSLAILLASGMRSVNEFEIIPILIDPHKDNEDLKRTISVLSNYQKITERAGINNGFFGTKVSTLQSLDTDNTLAGTYTFNLKEVSNTKFKDYFSYNSLNEENKALADLLFSGKTINANGAAVDLLDIPMDIGFVGNPNVGSVVLNQFKDSEEFRSFANNFNTADRIFIVSSIFGGTGAAGFPTILKNIRNAVNTHGIENPGYLQNASIGALTVLPYFNIEGAEKSPIKKSDFIEKTKAALGYYQANVNPSLNAIYYIGDDYNGKPYENDPGNNGQKNMAHFVEVAGALAILDYMNTSADELLTESGRPVHCVAKEYGIKADIKDLHFEHLGDFSNAELHRALTRMAIFKKYLDEQFESAIEKKAWATDHPAINKNFRASPFYTSNLRGFLNHFDEWLNELGANSRGFTPFDMKTSLNLIVKGKELKKGLFGFGKYSFDSFEGDLNKMVKKGSYASAEQKILDLFYQTTNAVVAAK
jgi:hypothetical protein